MTDSLDLPAFTKVGLDAAHVLHTNDVALAGPWHRVRGTARCRPAGRAGQLHGAAVYNYQDV
jgi:hypothetical protein